MAKFNIPTIKEMISAGVHFGHRTRRWNPRMEQYIYTVKKGVHIIDLERTESLLKEACEFLYEVASKGGDVIFVGTKRQAAETIELEAKNCGAMYVTERWIGGTLTNIRTIRKNIDKLLDYLSKRDAGEFEKYTKMERLLIDREIEKLTVTYGGITNLRRLPKAIFIIDPRREKTAVKEAKRCNVPIVSLIDTNSDPTEVNYPIPGNDDAIKAILLVLKSISAAIKTGYKEYELSKKEEESEEESIQKEEAKPNIEEGVVKVDDEYVEPGEKLDEGEREGKSKAGDEDLKKRSKINQLRDQLSELKKKREEVILERGKAAEGNKDLRENAAFDYLDQEERNVASQINMLMKEIGKLAKKEKSDKKSKIDKKKEDK
ncbi:30S ribosomal protein S2 [Patescibacteria group bacterium]|nr:30S ribosomal protein S2 [Patescibacteria group bacterium]